MTDLTLRWCPKVKKFHGYFYASIDDHPNAGILESHSSKDLAGQQLKFKVSLQTLLSS